VPCGYIRSEDTQLKRIRLREAEPCDASTQPAISTDARWRFCRPHFPHKPSAIVAANPYALMYSSLALRLSRLRASLIVTYHSTRLLG